MIDCPTHGPVDGLFCIRCGPPTAPRNKPIPAAAKARIDAILAKTRRPRDPDEEDERAAIQQEQAW